MGSANEKRYIDADLLTRSLDFMYPSIPTQYCSSQLEGQVNQLVHQALLGAFMSFKTQLRDMVEQAAVPYDKCMLCVQRDCQVPPNLS
jgi:hypothetical protein